MKKRLLAPMGAALAASALLAGAVSPASAAQAPPPAPDPSAWPHRDFAGGVRALTDVTYASQRGYRPLKLDLYLPPTPGLRPLVLWIHGGGWAVGDQRGAGVASPAYQDWPQTLAALAARGYVVAAVSYRLSGEARFPAAIHDVKAAVRWLRANAATYGVDAGRVIAWGGSAGGQLAALLGTSCGVAELEGPEARGADGSACVQGVVDFYGPTDFLQMDAQRLPGTNSPAHDTATSGESLYLGCRLSECAPGAVRLANPIAFVDETDPPFLIVHGEADTAVPPGQSRLLQDALKAKGVGAELVTIPRANHIFAGVSDAEGKAIIDRVFAFIDATAKPRR